MKRKRISIEELLIQFNTRSKLSQLISKYVTLTPRGNSFVGKCPFHDEKTPSFNVNDSKGLYHCFGCKAGGNVITFIQEFKNFSFPETIKYLSNYLGIDFVYEFFHFESKFQNPLLSKSVQFLGKNKNLNKFFIKFADTGLNI